MKNILSTPIVFVLLLFATSCDKEPTTQNLSISLNKNETYIYETNMSGDEEGANIVEQANHYLISETTRDPTFQIIYRYQPELDYIGTDKVIIVVESGSDGSSPSTNLEHISFNFTIAE